MLDEMVREAWLNVPYSEAMNAQYPRLNPSVPGPPYFVDTATARIGQWVRVVLRPQRGDDVFWCVGVVREVVDADRVRFGELAYEGGRVAPQAFKDKRWQGVLTRADNGGWHVTELREDEPPDPKPRILRRRPAGG
jgi:hypothetical protein